METSANDGGFRTAQIDPLPTLGTFVRIALLTGMRSGEITSLRREQIDFAKRVITVGRAKTANGTGRQIPMNPQLFEVLASHAEWYTGKFGETTPDRFIFPYGKPTPYDPTRPTTTIKTAWNTLRAKAGVKCRLHDLRHTALTKLAEAGTPESTMLAIAGHIVTGNAGPFLPHQDDREAGRCTRALDWRALPWGPCKNPCNGTPCKTELATTR